MKQIRESEFQSEVLEFEGIVIVDVFTEWCGYCHMLAPELEEAEEALPELKVVKIDAEKTVNFAHDYNIQFYPEMLIFKNGQLVGNIDGYVKSNVIIETIKEYM